MKCNKGECRYGPCLFPTRHTTYKTSIPRRRRRIDILWTLKRCHIDILWTLKWCRVSTGLVNICLLKICSLSVGTEINSNWRIQILQCLILNQFGIIKTWKPENKKDKNLNQSAYFVATYLAIVEQTEITIPDVVYGSLYNPQYHRLSLVEKTSKFCSFRYNVGWKKLSFWYY